MVLETTVLPLNDAPFFEYLHILTQLIEKYIPSKRDVFCLEICLFPRYSRFFVKSLLPAPMAEFLEFDLPLNLFLVFVGIIIPPFADGASQSNKGIGSFYLCHGENNNAYSLKMQTFRTEETRQAINVPPTRFELVLHG